MNFGGGGAPANKAPAIVSDLNEKNNLIKKDLLKVSGHPEALAGGVLEKLKGAFSRKPNQNEVKVEIKQPAFTMAEVLITIGIIGIVAAMTFPALLGNYRKVVTQNKLKVTYSLISQALQMVQAEHGMAFVPDEIFGSYGTADVNGYSWELSRDVFEHYFAPHFDIIRRFDKEEGRMKVCNAQKKGCWQLHLAYIVTLKNGVTIGYIQQMQGKDHTTLSWFIIVNPVVKDKNLVAGKDLFEFKVIRHSWDDVSSMNLMVPDYPELSRDKLKEYCISSTAHPYEFQSQDVFCTMLIFQNGMEIPDDYPVRL